MKKTKAPLVLHDLDMKTTVEGLSPSIAGIAKALDNLYDQVSASQKDFDNGNLPPLWETKSIRRRFDKTFKHVDLLIRNLLEMHEP